MSSKLEPTRPRDLTSPAPFGDPAEPAAPAVSPWQRVHGRLRGRYLWLVLLCAVGVVGGGLAGWNSAVPLFRSTGLVLVEQGLKSIDDLDGSRPMPGYPSYVSLQIQLLQARRTTLDALKTDEWKTTGEGSGPQTVESFEARRAIDHRHGDVHIQVSFDDPQRDVAIAGANALIGAYLELAEELSKREDMDLKSQVEDDIREVERSLKLHGDRIRTALQSYGSVEEVEIARRYALEDIQERLRALEAVNAEIREYELALANMDVAPLAPEEIARRDETMREYIIELKALEAEKALLLQEMKEANEKMKPILRAITVQKLKIEWHAESWNNTRAAERARLKLDEPQKRAIALTEEIAKLRVTTRKLDSILRQVSAVQGQVDNYQDELKRLKGIRKRLEERIDGKGRVKLGAPGHSPISAYQDRRARNAVIGGFLGGLLGFLIVFVIGLLDRRLRGVGDVSQELPKIKLLGLLPALPGDLSDPLASQIAIHCVHQIRTLLQIGYAKERGACICVTGPGAGSGKTTLTTALGLSFGNSGSRTLLIDADLTGRGLTHRVARILLSHVRRAAGRETREGGEWCSTADTPRSLLEPLVSPDAEVTWPAPEELTRLLREAVEKRGLPAVRESGLVADFFALADLLFAAEERENLAGWVTDILTSEGLTETEALPDWIPPRTLELGHGRIDFDGATLDRYTFRTSFANLRLLPLRGLGRGGEISIEALSRILARVRDEFDVALLDTGPVTGTVETSMLAARADCVALVVSLGDQRLTAERAVAHLEEVGAQLAGVVFNRAEQREILRTSLSYYAAGDEAVAI